MQAFKTLLIVAVLSAVAYGVYVALTGARDVEPPPGVVAEDWQGGPQIELPTMDGSQNTPPANLTGAPPAAASPAPQVVQPQTATAVEAPPFTATPAAPDTSAAPPFVAPSVGPSNPGALPGGDGSAGLAPPPVNDATMTVPDVQQPPIGDGAMNGANVVQPAGNAPPASGLPESTFATDFATAQALLAESRLDPALLLLSRWYDDPRLTEQDQQALMPLLNQLAGTVIYSQEHFLLPAYEVQPGDTLDRVAQQYRVPWQILAKINGVGDPNQLRPGDKLKVVQGPFDASVNMRTRQLTMMLGGRFAGRFPIGIGADQAAPEGEFVVKNKTPNPTYYGPDRVIDANDPANPLGKYWIGLDDHFGIHGTNDPGSIGQANSPGCIRLSPRDIEDVYDMMTSESRVRIVR
ncbi:MAG TPA: L,D-transpeptidase family protein [Pirellulales bacterium]|nr:L,D-transpeptidase family protein [Pirellulales bacterium]